MHQPLRVPRAWNERRQCQAEKPASATLARIFDWISETVAPLSAKGAVGLLFDEQNDDLRMRGPVFGSMFLRPGGKGTMPRSKSASA